MRERAQKLGADYQPHFLLVDEEGRIVTSLPDGGDEQMWEAMIEQLS